MRDILRRTANTNDPKLLSIRKDAAAHINNLVAKVDDTQLRRKQMDLLPKLIEIMNREEKRLPKPKVIDVQPFSLEGT